MTSAMLEPIRGDSLCSQVVESIRDAIYSGRFKPGEPLRELQLARDLHVSQTTVREGLLQLEHAGLVVREANRGTRVTSLSDDEIRERVAVRIVLESMAAVEAAVRMELADMQALFLRLEDIAAAVRRNDYFRCAQADLEFHRHIWRMSGNRTLFGVLERLSAPFFAFVSVLQSSGLENLASRVRSHRPIVLAIKSGDAERIRAAIRDHIETSYRRFAKHRVVAAGASQGKG